MLEWLHVGRSWPKEVPVLRPLDLAQGDEFGVAEEAAGGPFGEFDFGFDFGTEPGEVGHFVGGDALAPVTTTRWSADT